MFISHGACVRRDISSSGAFLFLSFFYAATNTCFEAGHAFSKQSDSPRLPCYTNQRAWKGGMGKGKPMRLADDAIMRRAPQESD